MDKKLVIGGSVVAVLLLGGLGYWFLQPSASEPAATETADAAPAKSDKTDVADAGTCTPKAFTVTADDYVVGDANAPITMVEYFSQTCSHCADFQRDTFPKLNEAYIKTGIVRLVVRDFQRNNVDLAASIVGRCLGREGFLPFTELLLTEQQTWLGRQDQNVREGLKEMAKRAGMTSEAFETCMKKEDEAKKLASAIEQTAKDYCIDGTPSLYLNGKKLENAQEFAVLEVYIKGEMKKLSLTLPEKKEDGAK